MYRYTSCISDFAGACWSRQRYGFEQGCDVLPVQNQAIARIEGVHVDALGAFGQAPVAQRLVCRIRCQLRTRKTQLAIDRWAIVVRDARGPELRARGRPRRPALVISRKYLAKADIVGQVSGYRLLDKGKPKLRLR